MNIVGGLMLKKRIALFSDIHGNYQVLKSIFDDINETVFDEVICLGDVIGIGPDSSLCLDNIINSKVKMVLGNHELYQIRGTNIDKLTENVIKHEEWVKSTLREDQISYLEKCPLSLEMLDKGRIFSFSHFLLKKEENNYPFLPLSIVNDSTINKYLEDVSSEYCFFGHEHNSFEIKNNSQVFYCIGSSGCNQNDITFYTVLEIYDDFIKIYKKYLKYDRKKFEKTMKNIDYPNKKSMAEIFFKMEI